MSRLGEAWQVLSDCPHCRCEAAVVHVMDPHHPATHLGVPAESRCRLCGHTVRAADEPFVPQLPVSAGRCPACQKTLSEKARAGEEGCPSCHFTPKRVEVRKPADLTSPDAARAALAAWAKDDGEPDVDQFCRANMGKPTDAVVLLLQKREVVHTTFDVIAYLFPGSSGSSAAVAEKARMPEVVDRPQETDDQELPPDEDTEEEESDDDPVTEADTGTMDPRTPARVLISVMVADGELRVGEERFIQSFLEREGLPAMARADYRVWRPTELGAPPPPAFRDRLIEACVHLMHVDREADGTELKVIQSYSRAWGLPDERLESWLKRYDARYTSAMGQLWRSLTRLVRVR